MREEEIARFVRRLLETYRLDMVFISAPPSFQRLHLRLGCWEDSRIQSTIMPVERLTTLEESVVQQFVCSRAKVFIPSVPASTWAQTVIRWQHDTAVTMNLENFITNTEQAF